MWILLHSYRGCVVFVHKNFFHKRLHNLLNNKSVQIMLFWNEQKYTLIIKLLIWSYYEYWLTCSSFQIPTDFLKKVKKKKKNCTFWCWKYGFLISQRFKASQLVHGLTKIMSNERSINHKYTCWLTFWSVQNTLILMIDIKRPVICSGANA